MSSVRYHQRPKLSVARRESEKQQLPAGPELAYLVVDLQSGTLSQTSGESGLLCVHCTYVQIYGCDFFHTSSPICCSQLGEL